MERSVIHLNVADFAVAVERAVDRRLQRRPLVIAPEGAVRAVVYDMSEEAYQAGVRKGMALGRARRLCPTAAILPPHPARYVQAMQTLVRQARPYSPLVEPGIGDGHLFVDVTGTGRLFGPPADVAWRLRRQAREALGLAPVWSVAANKLVAKVATRLVKPGGECVVAPGNEAAFLSPLPLGLLPGIERDDLVRLADFNLTRAGQVAALGLAALQVPFGNRAYHFYETVRGIDPSPVRPASAPPPQVTVDHTFDEDAHTPAILEAALYALVEDVGRELRRRRLAACRVAIRLGFSDGLVRVRQRRLRPATARDPALYDGARAAFYLAWNRRVRIRSLGLIAGGLTFPPAQQALFPEARMAARQEAQLVTALDRIRDRFGAEAIRMGRTLAA